MPTRPLRFAFLGSRGIPSCYGGFETFYENLGARLVERGHRVTVYCRSHYPRPRANSWRGVRLVEVPTIRTKHLETLVHTFLSVLHAATQGYDVVYVCTVGNSPLCALARLLTRATVVLNVDGNDWDRPKWGRLARWYIRASMRLASWASDEIVVDSEVMREKIETTLGFRPSCIPYGASVDGHGDPGEIDRLGFHPGGYVLFVGRLVPCNGVRDLVQAWRKVRTDKKLVIVGDAPYVERYKKEVRHLAAEDPRVVLMGYRFGEDYRVLSRNACFYVLPSAVEGTRPVILDQMGFGKCVLVPDSAANLRTIGGAGATYPAGGGVEALARGLEDLLASPDKIRDLGERARRRIAEHFEWEGITDRYERFFRGLVGGNGLGHTATNAPRPEIHPLLGPTEGGRMGDSLATCEEGEGRGSP